MSMKRTIFCVFAAAGLLANGSCTIGDGSPEPVETPTATATDALSASGTATLAEYWAGKAQWKLVAVNPEPNAGAHINVVGGNWYLFSRSVSTGLPGCDVGLGTRVQRSTDRGQTWSASVDVLVPTAGTPWECDATDGDAFYDAAQNRWHYLFQCLKPGGAWSGCHVVRNGADPMGPFAPVPGETNPVITPGSLWNRICDVATDDCSSLAGGPGRVVDEGTFNIFHKDGNGQYFISFHGYDGVRGYRGIAKTSDFVTYVAGDPNQGVPGDAVIDLRDAQGWRESWAAGGNVGPGAGSILLENGVFYQINEVADVNLGCTAGQDWDWGMTRSTSLTSTTWEQMPRGNPFYYSSKEAADQDQAHACNPAYARLFRDPATNVVYLNVTRISAVAGGTGTLLYQLVPSRNLLTNGDLWTCGADAWSRAAGTTTNYVAYRRPALSSDYGCYLATNCGNSTCQNGEGFYQDVDVSTLGAQQISFGGKFAVDSGTGASMTLKIFELDASYAILASHAVDVTPGTTYQLAASSFTMGASTKKLRYQVYPHTPHTFRADEMFMEIASCQPAQTTWTATSLPHQIGRADADGWSASTSLDAAGYLQYGPYVTTLSAGAHTATWDLMVDNNAADNTSVARVEVYDATSATLLASREVMRKEFSAPWQYQSFSLSFTIDTARLGHQIELRTYWYRTSYVREQRVSVDASCAPAQLAWDAAGLWHNIGRADNDGWSANTAADAVGYLQFGPYTTAITAGAHTATWQLMVDNDTADDLAVVRLEAYDTTTATVLASRQLTRKQWTATYAYQPFSLPFVLDASRVGHTLEFRVYWYRTSYVREQRLTID